MHKKESIKTRRGSILNRVVQILKDNASIYNSNITEMGEIFADYEIRTHSSNSHDLAPFHFHLFSTIKLYLKVGQGADTFIKEVQSRLQCQHVLLYMKKTNKLYSNN